MVLSHWQLIPANRRGLAVARWQIDSGTDELVLEIFQEAPVEPGLLDAIVLSVVLLRSGNPLGDSSGDFLSDPKSPPPIQSSMSNIFRLAAPMTPGKASE